jgi:hypothetical protein
MARWPSNTFRTTNQLADILTKSLGRIQFQDLRARIGIIDITKN